MMNPANGQDHTPIAGAYALGGGGSHLIVLENGTFAVVYFGGMKTGQWELIKDNVYRFTPIIKETKFEIYGRHNKDLKDSLKIFFNGFENSETFIRLENPKEKSTVSDAMQRVFNLGANCFDYPYVHTFKTEANRLSFASKEYGKENSPIITFNNPEGYNDFVAIFNEQDDLVQPFIATYKADGLYFDEGDFALRSPLEESGEDLGIIRNLIEKVEIKSDALYLNPSYNRFGGGDDDLMGSQDIHERHMFNEQKNAFIDLERYTEGAEYSTSDYSYEDMSIIYSYKILKVYAMDHLKYKINEKALFIVNCD